MEISWFTTDKLWNRLTLSWTKVCELSKHHNRITGATLQTNNAKPYVPVDTLSINDNIKFLENIARI